MKKTLLQCLLLLLSCYTLKAQTTNEKLIFPSPANIDASEGQFLIQTADGGYLLTGSISASLNGGAQSYPRLIKLAADLDVEWDKSYLIPPPPAGAYTTVYSPALQTPDGGYALACRNDSTPTDLIRLDATGEVLWEKNLVPWSASPILLLQIFPDGGMLLTNKRDAYTLYRLDAAGNVVLQKDLLASGPNGAISTTVLSGGNLLTAFRTANTKMNFLCTDVDGNTLWTKQLTGAPFWVSNLGSPDFAATPGGGFVVLAYDATLQANRLYQFDGLGNELFVTPETAIPNTLRPTSVAVTATGQFLLSGNTVTNRGFVALLNAAGDAVEWSAESPEDTQEHLVGLNAIPTSDGWAAGVGKSVGNKFGFLKIGANTGITFNTLSGRVAKDDDNNCLVEASESGLNHVRVNATNGLETFGDFTDANGNYSMILPAGDYTLTVNHNVTFFELCATANNTVSFPAGMEGTELRDLPMQSLDLIHEISGHLYLDQNDNCVADPGEPALQNWTVNVHSTFGTIYLKTDADGFYKIFVPDGDYSVWVSEFNVNFDMCTSTQYVSFVGPDPQLATFDFLAKPAFFCARMRAELSGDFRSCVTRTLYAQYRNDGTTIADDATLVVTLDPLLMYESATPAPDAINGQELTFNLGDVAPAPGGYWQSIQIQVKADCALVPGDQVCVSAAVTPDEDCTQQPGWSGAIVAANGTCDPNDDAIFIIKNVGNAQNTQVLDYIITEDQIVLREGTFQLQPGQEIRDTVPGNGSPLTLIAQQEPGYPGDTSVVWNIVNCGGNTGQQYSSSGFGGPAGPFVHQECFNILNSYDPNDKNAIPAGNGPQHLVHPGTPLEYHIRFQNTGNDTAYLVVIRDTLSKHFNFGKIEPRASSHQYQFAQISDSIVQFTFENILLPDSTTNLAASQGFVDFSVYPKDDLPNGTEVLNSAAIYFDFNPPVITNTVSRVYGKYVVEVVKTKEINGKPALPVTVYPNPFVTEATFEIPESAAEATYQLGLFDASGRTLRTLSFDNKKCLLRRDDLPAGVMTWSISANGAMVAGGQIVAQ